MRLLSQCLLSLQKAITAVQKFIRFVLDVWALDCVNWYLFLLKMSNSTVTCFIFNALQD